MNLQTNREGSCHHCGDLCDGILVYEKHIFCCYGCQAMYKLLSNSRLGMYYNKTSRTNQSLSLLKAKRKYVFLNNTDIANKLLRFQNNTLSIVRFFLPDIHCSSCIYLLEKLPELEKSMLRSEVNFIRKEVTISFDHHRTKLQQVAVLLSQLGYPPDISLDSIDKTKARVRIPDVGIKIAVAGFCFGNVMLMSMPEYLDHNLLLTKEFKEFFGWISLALALPIVFYAGADYFDKAWKGLKIGNLNMDTPIALGILTLFIRSTYEIVTSTGSGYMDSLAGLVFFLLIGKWYQGKSYHALSFERDYTSYLPISVTCLINNEEVERPIKALKKDDTVMIHHDELIPADGKIVKGLGRIDYSFVTGESNPDEKKLGQKVFAGGRQKGSELVIKLEKGVDSSELTQLWNSEAFKKSRKALQTWVDKVSKYFTFSILAIAGCTGGYWWVVDPDVVWNAMTAVLIVACPCALALVLPFAYGHAMRALGRIGLYLKNAEVVEALSKIDQIVFDKTGTLTHSSSGVLFNGAPFSDFEGQLLKSALSNSAHPLSRIIYNTLPPIDKLPLESFEEVTGKGFTAVIQGYEIKVGSSEWLGMDNHEDNHKPVNESYVHIFAHRYLGYFKISSSYRKGIFDMLKRLKSCFVLSLLSGDNEAEKPVLTPYFNHCYFKQKPKDKLRFLEGKSETCLMVGDGLNDAGALKEASVGIAVAEDIHQFSPACDAILKAEKINKMPHILKFSQSVIRIVFVAFSISFLYNLVGLSFAVSGHLTPLLSAVLMPLSSVTVVGFVTLMIAWRSKTDGISGRKNGSRLHDINPVR